MYTKHNLILFYIRQKYENIDATESIKKVPKYISAAFSLIFSLKSYPAKNQH